jgi:hypothetical protein
MNIVLAKGGGVKFNVMITKGRFVDEATSVEIRQLAARARCSTEEIVAACDVLANPARALAVQLGVAESRASEILSIINAQGAKLSGMKAKLAPTSHMGRR